jgi:hypothetical protein
MCEVGGVCSNGAQWGRQQAAAASKPPPRRRPHPLTTRTGTAHRRVTRRDKGEGGRIGYGAACETLTALEIQFSSCYRPSSSVLGPPLQFLPSALPSLRRPYTHSLLPSSLPLSCPPWRRRRRRSRPTMGPSSCRSNSRVSSAASQKEDKAGDERKRTGTPFDASAHAAVPPLTCLRCLTMAAFRLCLAALFVCCLRLRLPPPLPATSHRVDQESGRWIQRGTQR